MSSKKRYVCIEAKCLIVFLLSTKRKTNSRLNLRGVHKDIMLSREWSLKFRVVESS